jgi:hypothetical protein
MHVFIPPIDLSFGDFMLLAILLALMYGLTGLELAVTLPRRDFGTQEFDRRQAAGWAFAGILLTIVAGLVAAAELGPAEPFLLFLPLFFMARWAYYHGASASLANVQVVRQGLEDQYREAVLASLSEESQTSAEVFGAAVTKIGALTMLERASVLTRGIVPVPAKALVEDLLFTPQKVESILASLVSDGLAEKYKDGDILRYRRTLR